MIAFRCQFHQVFIRAFFLQKCFAQLWSSSFWVCIFWQKDIGKKSPQKNVAEIDTRKIAKDENVKNSLHIVLMSFNKLGTNFLIMLLVIVNRNIVK